MNLRRMAGGAALTATAALTLAACGGGSGSGSAEQGGESSSMSSSSMASSSMPSSSSAEAGVTTASDVYGPACGQVPTEGEGSVSGMIDDPVATAASNNPLLDKLEAAVKAAGLVDTLNSAEAVTVFAPYDKAFEALGKEKFQQLAGQPEKLASILQLHVVPKRMDAEGLAKAGEVQTLNKSASPLAIEGSGQDITVNGNKVLCGNVPTANATVFVIDKVMTPGQSS